MSLHGSSIHGRTARGFTLIETMIAVSIAGVLSSIAYPSFTGQLQRARRTDAMVTLMQAQLAQERFRSGNAGYGSLAEIGVRDRSLSGHYAVEVRGNAAETYEIVASASGAQAGDTTCRTIRLSQVSGTGLVFASGPDASASNPTDINRKCWNR